MSRRPRGRGTLLAAGLATAIGVATPSAAQIYTTDVETLRAEVIRRLSALEKVEKALPDPKDPANIIITLLNARGEQFTVHSYVGNLFGRLRSSSDTDAEIQAFVETITAVASPPPPLEVTRIFANIRHKDWLKQFADSDGKGAEENLIYQHLPGDIIMVYQVGNPMGYSTLTPAEAGGRSASELWTLSQENITRELAYLNEERLSQTASLYTIGDSSIIGPAMLLSDSFWSKLEARFPAGAYVIAPRRDLVFAYDKQSPTAIADANEQIRKTVEERVDLLSEVVFERRDGKLVVADE